MVEGSPGERFSFFLRYYRSLQGARRLWRELYAGHGGPQPARLVKRFLLYSSEREADAPRASLLYLKGASKGLTANVA